MLFAESILFIITCLSLGLLISNITSSQQTAMLISMMGMMLPTLLLTGFMFPLENMPLIFCIISHVIPSRYYYIIVKDAYVDHDHSSYSQKLINKIASSDYFRIAGTPDSYNDGLKMIEDGRQV